MMQSPKISSLWAMLNQPKHPLSRNVLDILPDELLQEIIRWVVASEMPNVFGLTCNSSYSKNATLRLERLVVLCLVSRRFHRIAMPMLFERNWFLSGNQMMDPSSWGETDYRDGFFRFKEIVDKKSLNHRIKHL